MKMTKKALMKFKSPALRKRIVTYLPPDKEISENEIQLITKVVEIETNYKEIFTMRDFDRIQNPKLLKQYKIWGFLLSKLAERVHIKEDKYKSKPLKGDAYGKSKISDDSSW